MQNDADLDALLGLVLEQEPAERGRFLDAAVGTDTAIRASVDRLLRELDDEDPFLRPGGALGGTFGQVLADDLALDEGLPLGNTIGPYRVVAELGRGGMAVVYRAERADGAFAQQVALKIIKRGIDTDEALTRFRQERQILASLEHSGIARLLDGGVTPDGRPYLAMELVSGEPIDRYCEQRALDVDLRVDLVIAVAQVVEHAHRRLVVHRDLKPSNIFVTAEGEIKLLDFGIAKLLDPAVDYAAPPTRTAVRVMTPEYASPEQVRGGLITTASDVYQLGLILFELVAGRRARRLDGLSTAEAERVICEREPRRPSTSITGTDPAATRLRRRLRGDLDNIVLKALNQEPERRYASVGNLVDDLERYRRGLPVAARGDSLRYRSEKFLRRHRLAAGAAAAVVVLIGAIVSFYSVRLASERDRARQEAAAATQVADFLTGLFQVANPDQSSGATLTARELLDRGAGRIDVELAAQPELQSRMMNLIGGIYRSLGINEQAIPLLERTLASRRARLGPNHPDVAESLQSLGLVLYNAGRFDEAKPMLEEALTIQEATLGPSNDALATTLNSLGLLQRRLGRFEQARDFLERALAVRERALGRDHYQLGPIANNLGLVFQSLGDQTRARNMFERALVLHERKYGPESSMVGSTLSNLGESFRRTGDLAGARPLLERSLAISEKTYGRDHRNTGTSANALGLVLRDMKLYDDARRQFEDAERIYTRSLGPGHAYLAYPVENLGLIYQALGDNQRALVQFKRGLEIREAAFGPLHRDVSQSLEYLGIILVRLNDCREAAPVLQRALDISRKTMPADSPRIGTVSSALGWCVAESRRYADAEPLLVDGHRILHAQRGPAHESTQTALKHLVDFYERWGKPAQAATYRAGLAASEPARAVP